MNPSQQVDWRARYSLFLAEEAEREGDHQAAEEWRAIAKEYQAPAQGGDVTVAPTVRIPHAGEIEAASVQNEAGYYYHDALSGRWVPTTQEDALAREQAGQKVMKPGGRGQDGAV